MKTPLVKSLCALAAGLTVLVSANAQTTVGIDPTYGWIGYMNVFGINGDGSPNYGAFQFGQPWGTADLRAAFSGTNLYITLNTNVWETNDTYWVQNEQANKWMDASFYVQNDGLAGQAVTFVGTCASNTISAPDATSTAFIKDFTPSYSGNYSATANLVSGQPFSITLYTNPGDHIQFGFETQGPDVNPTNLVNTGIVILNEGSPDPSVSPIAGQAAVQGQNVTFTAVAKGTSPFSYQWSFANQDIAGATTSTLTLPDVQTTNAGTYTVEITNVNGTTEATAALAVEPLSQAQTNLLLDPSFESGQFAASSTAGWANFNGSYIANTNEDYYQSTNEITSVDGSNVFQAYSTGAGSYNGCYQDRPALPGQVYTGFIWMLTPSVDEVGGVGACFLEVQFRDNGGNILYDFESPSVTSNTTPNIWMKMTPTIPVMVAPANTADVRFQVTYHADTGGSVYSDMADLRLREPVSTPVAGANQFKISFPTLYGPVYNVFYKNHLTDASWTLLTSVNGDGTVKTVTDSGPASQRFYIVNTQ
jgi:Immunoglobulin domain